MLHANGTLEDRGLFTYYILVFTYAMIDHIQYYTSSLPPSLPLSPALQPSYLARDFVITLSVSTITQEWSCR